MAWVDVRKAYDSVDHGWLREMFTVHKFPVWLCKVINKLSASWKTRISVRTVQGVETSEVITFRRGLPQGSSLGCEPGCDAGGRECDRTNTQGL